MTNAHLLDFALYTIHYQLVNDRNAKNQFRPKPKFRPSWPKLRPNFRPKFYPKITWNWGVFLKKNFSKPRHILKNDSNVCYRGNFKSLKWLLVNKKNSYYILKNNCLKTRQKFVKIAFFGHFGISVAHRKIRPKYFGRFWPKFRPKFRFRSYTIKNGKCRESAFYVE